MSKIHIRRYLGQYGYWVTFCGRDNETVPLERTVLRGGWRVADCRSCVKNLACGRPEYATKQAHTENPTPGKYPDLVARLEASKAALIAKVKRLEDRVALEYQRAEGYKAACVEHSKRDNTDDPALIDWRSVNRDAQTNTPPMRGEVFDDGRVETWSTQDHTERPVS